MPTLLEQLAELRGDATPLGVAHAALAEAASDAQTSTRVEREFFDLFIGLGRGELLPYASYYLTGFLHERPLARLREDLAALGIERAEGSGGAGGSRRRSCARSWRASRAAICRRRPDADRDIFEKHLAPWIGRFFADLETRARRRISTGASGPLGRVFMEIETEAFALPS